MHHNSVFSGSNNILLYIISLFRITFHLQQSKIKLILISSVVSYEIKKLESQLGRVFSLNQLAEQCLNNIVSCKHSTDAALHYLRLLKMSVLQDYK